MSGEMPQDKFDYTCQNFWPKIMESSFNWMASQSVKFRSLPYIYDAFPINLSKYIHFHTEFRPILDLF
jgi:hypothetical protein